MPWTLQHADTTQSLEAWGFTAAVVALESFAPSTLTLRRAANFDSAALFAYGDTVTLRDPDDVVSYVGKLRQMPRSVAGSDETLTYIAEDVLGDLARRTFTQTWLMVVSGSVTGVDSALLAMFADEDGDAVSISSQLTNIVTAAAAAGISVQMGDSDDMTVNPRMVDAKAMTYLEALKFACQMAPDCGTQVDYTTTPPTLHFIRRINATERTLAVLSTADNFVAEPLHNQQVSEVYLTYERRSVIGGEAFNEWFTDVHPEGSDGTAENALVAHTELRGNSPSQPAALDQSQELTVSGIDAEDFDWWEALWPDLVDRSGGATLADGDITPSGLPNQIISGATPSWEGSSGQVTVSALFNGTINGVPYVNKRLVAVVNATSLSSGTYTRVSSAAGGAGSDPGEAVPVGLAALYHSALSVLHWSGHHAVTEDEPAWTVQPADVVNFSGTELSALSTARAQVTRVEHDLVLGSRRIEFGPPPYLAFADFIDLLRLQRNLSIGTRAGERDGSDAAQRQSVAGVGLGPGASMTPTADVELHPWKCTKIGSTGNTFRVEGGSYDGVAIAAETVDIGATRPRYIYIESEWTVTAWQDRFAAEVVRSADPAPSIASSTSSTSSTLNIPIGASTVKHLLAVVGSGDVVTQLETRAALLPVWKDDGSLDGSAALVSS